MSQARIIFPLFRSLDRRDIPSPPPSHQTYRAHLPPPARPVEAAASDGGGLGAVGGVHRVVVAGVGALRYSLDRGQVTGDRRGGPPL